MSDREHSTHPAVNFFNNKGSRQTSGSIQPIGRSPLEHDNRYFSVAVVCILSVMEYSLTVFQVKSSLMFRNITRPLMLIS